MQIANTLPELIGNTPLLRLERFAPGAGVLAKLESFNPLSSAKDRAGLYMILDAEERGLLQPGAVIVEPTSGNTGVALAYIGRQRGYRVVLTMPETMSQERRSLLAALGAELVLTEGARGMGGAIERAKELLESTPGAWMPDQFNNPANARAHYETTGPELWRDTDGGVDVLVAGVGSGGTITGAGRYLKEQNPAIRVVAVEPAESPVLSGGRPGPHQDPGHRRGLRPRHPGHGGGGRGGGRHRRRGLCRRPRAGPYRGGAGRGVLRRGGPRGPHPGPAAGHAGQDHRGGAPRYWRALPLYRAVCVNRARWTQSAAWLRPQAFCLWPEPYYVWSWASRAARSGSR